MRAVKFSTTTPLACAPPSLYFIIHNMKVLRPVCTASGWRPAQGKARLGLRGLLSVCHSGWLAVRLTEGTRARILMKKKKYSKKNEEIAKKGRRKSRHQGNFFKKKKKA